MEKKHFELVDLGSGSGMLGAEICKEVTKRLHHENADSMIRAWMIDLSLNDPKRFFANGMLGTLTDHLSSVGVDYQDWFTSKYRLPKPKGIRVGLISKFFNNLSHFETISIPVPDLVRLADVKVSADNWSDHLPVSCLHPAGKGPEFLRHSNARIWLSGGRSFAQPSLSRYFQGLHLLRQVDNSLVTTMENNDTAYLPLRSFRPECLFTYEGRSVLEKMLEDCRLLVVQDSDLRPEDLSEHKKSMKSSDIVGMDMTKTLGLRGSYSYVLLRESDPGLRSMKGSRLW
jgi:hypothetical protein